MSQVDYVSVSRFIEILSDVDGKIRTIEESINNFTNNRDKEIKHIRHFKDRVESTGVKQSLMTNPADAVENYNATYVETYNEMNKEGIEDYTLEAINEEFKDAMDYYSGSSQQTETDFGASLERGSVSGGGVFIV